MTIRYECPECDSVLTIRDDKAGKQGRCPKCKSEFVIPQPEKDAGVTGPAAVRPVSPEHSLLVNESLRQRFEASWAVGKPEQLAKCLPGADENEFLPTLEELVHIQLEFAWKTHSADTERPVSVQALLDEFPVLGDDAVLAQLLRQEYHCRETAGDSPSADDYRRAFPELDLDQLTTPPGETVGPRASDDTATGVATGDQATLPPGEMTNSPVPDDRTLDAPVAASSPADEQTLAPPAADEKPSSIQDDATLAGGTPGVAIDVDNSSDTFNTGSPASSAPIELGKQVPGYELLGELGRGGMGVVYRALDTRLKRVVALKMILSGVHADEGDLKRFQREAEAVAQLQHPNIVQIHDVGEHDGQPFFSLEFVEGGGLDEKIGGEPQPPSEAAALVEQLARAVHFAHERNIVHRDLKPANVLLTAEGEPKITDFGLAKRLEEDASQTASGSIMGTPSYMAPEQAGDELATIGPQTDVYALGAMLYCLLTGRPPFQSSSVMDTVMQVLEQEPVSPGQLVEGLDRNLETITLKCLQKSPERRYQSAEEVAEELRCYQAGEPIQARPIGQVERVSKWVRRRPAMAGLVGVSVAALVVMIIGGLWYNRQLQGSLDLAEARKVEADSERAFAEARKTQAEALRAEAERQQDKAVRAQKVAEQAQEELKEENQRRLSKLYATTISLAYQQWQAGRIMGAEKLLDSTPSNFRGWEFDYLKYIFHPELMTLRGHTDAVTEIRYSPDGKRLVSIQRGGLVHVWDISTGSVIKTRKTRSRVISPDGQWIVSIPNAEPHKLLVVPILAGGEPIALQDKRGKRRGFPVAFSRNGKKLVTYAKRKTDGGFSFNLWDVQARKVLREFDFPGTDGPLPAALSPDGKLFAWRAKDSSLVIRDVEAGMVLHRFPGFFLTQLNLFTLSTMTFSPDGHQLAASDGDGGIWIHDLPGGSRRAILRGHTGQVFGLSFSPDGQRIVSAGEDMTIRIWDIDTMRQMLILRGHTAGQTYGVLGVAFSPDGRRLASGGWDMTIKTWDTQLDQMSAGLVSPAASAPAETATRKKSPVEVSPIKRGASVEYATLAGHTKAVEGLCFSPDSERLASASWDGTVRVFDLKANRSILTFDKHGGGKALANGQRNSISSVVFSPDGRLVASGSGGSNTTAEGEVLIWESATGKLRHTLKGHKLPISMLRFMPDGKQLVSGAGNQQTTDKGELKTWDVTTGKTLLNFTEVKSPVMSLAISPDATLLATGHWEFNSGIHLWDLKTGKPLRSFDKAIVGIVSVAFSPDGKLLAGGGTDWAVRVWDVATSKQLWKEKGHAGAVYGVRFSPNGRRLVSASVDSTIKIWNPQTGQDLLTLNDGEVLYRVDLSPDGRLVASTGVSGQIRIRATPGKADQETKQWPLILADDFEREKLGDHWHVAVGSCSIEKGILKYVLEKETATGLDLVYSQLRLRDRPLPSTVDVSFDFWTPHELNCGVNFHDETEAIGVAGMFMGTGHILFNNGEKGTTTLVFGGGAPRSVGTNDNVILEPNRRYRFRILREPTQLTLFVDGEEVLSNRVPRFRVHILYLQALFGKVGDVAYLDNLEIRAPRSTAAERSAFTLVKKLYSDLPVTGIVIDRIRQDKELSKPVREEALEIATTYKRDDPTKAADLVWKRLLVGKPGEENYTPYLRYAQESVRTAPQSWRVQRLLAAAQLRTGDAQASLKTLATAETRYRQEFGHAAAATTALRALTHHALKNVTGRAQALNRLEDLMRSEFFSNDADTRTIADQARKLQEPSPDQASSGDLESIRRLTFLPQQAGMLRNDMAAWKQQWSGDARIIRGREEAPGPYDVVRSLAQEVSFEEFESRIPPPIGRRLVRDTISIELNGDRAVVLQKVVGGRLSRGANNSSVQAFKKVGQTLKLLKSPSGWKIVESRTWPLESKSARGLNRYKAEYWVARDAMLATVRKKDNLKPSEMAGAFYNAFRFKEGHAFRMQQEKAYEKDPTYWLHRVMFATQLNDIATLRLALDRCTGVVSGTKVVSPLMRDVSARKHLASKPTPFKQGVRLRLPTYATLGEASDLALPGEVCGVWETAPNSVAGVYVNTVTKVQTVDELLSDSELHDMFKAMGARVLSQQLQAAGKFPSASFIVEGMGHGNSFDPAGPLLTRGRWVYIPHGKKVYGFLFVSPAWQADALNAEFEVTLKTLSFNDKKNEPAAAGKESCGPLRTGGQ